MGPHRFFFYASDRAEPVHIHVEGNGRRAKFWLDPLRSQDGGAFRDVELARIAALVERHHTLLRRAWDDNFQT